MRCLNVIAFILVIIGAINWGLYGVAHFDLVSWLFNNQYQFLMRAIYIIIGLAGVWAIGFFCQCKSRRSRCCSCNKEVSSDKDKENCCKHHEHK